MRHPGEAINDYVYACAKRTAKMIEELMHEFAGQVTSVVTEAGFPPSWHLMAGDERLASVTLETGVASSSVRVHRY
jgi:hypothetical protein